MRPMRFTATLTALPVLALAAAAVPEHIEYPWCAVYGDDFGGSNCGFSTIEQCRATVSGIGGSCEPNPFYTPPAQKPARSKRQVK